MARDYQRENAVTKSKPKEIEKRVDRNRARAILTRKVGKAAVAGKEVHHVNGRTGDDRLSNLKAVKPSTHNFGRAGAQGGKLKK